MKGVVFTEFIEMVEDQMSPEAADDLIEACNLPSKGAYTAVGSYDHVEILQLVTKLSEMTDLPVPQLVTGFGKHLLSRFSALYPHFFLNVNNTFEFLETIETHVHVDVLKLYPDAELPSFVTEISGNTMTMEYRSTRPFIDLAEGLILGAAEYFNENIKLTREDLTSAPNTHAIFTLERV